MYQRLAHLVFALVSLSTPFALASSVATASFDAGEFDANVIRLHRESGAPGLAVAVIQDGVSVFEKGYGVAGPNQQSVSVETVFQTGSITKAFVALVIQQMADEGKLELDAPVVKYLPDFRTADQALSGQITIDHLITHRSGLTTMAGNSGHAADITWRDPADAVHKLRSVQLFSEPGNTFQYSNANYVVLSHLIETVDQRSFEEALHARIFKPLNMQHSYVTTISPDSMHVATPHRIWFGWPLAWQPKPKEPPDRTMIGAGGIATSIEDLAVFVDAVRSRDPSVVPKTADRLFALNPFWGDWGYGYGWYTQSGGPEPIFEHSGFTPGFFALAVMLPDSGTTVVVLTNLSGLVQGDLPRAVVHAALNWEPMSAKAPFTAHLAIWSALMAPLGLFVLFVKTIHLLRSSARGTMKKRSVLDGLLGLMLVIFSITGYIIYPQLMNLSYGASIAFFPDLTFTVFAAIGMALLSGIARLMLFLRT